MSTRPFTASAAVFFSTLVLACTQSSPAGDAPPIEPIHASAGAAGVAGVGGATGGTTNASLPSSGAGGISTGIAGSGGSAGAGQPTLSGSPPADGVYALHSVHSGKCLSIADASSQNGAALVQATCAGGAGQRFQLKSLGDGSYSLINQGSGKALDVKDQSVSAGALLQQWDWAQSANQRFKITPAGNGDEISAVNSGLALSVADASLLDNAVVVQEPWRSADEQRWTFESVAPGGAIPPTDPSHAGWTLAWADDFNGADGSAIDASKWSHDVGGSGWGNQELEYYTDQLENSQQRGGNLVLTATRDGASAHSCWNGACQFSSARLVTSGHFSAAYGRIEARIKIPSGKGIWPAFWMLGDDIGSAGWPTCGEIDIMETIGSDPSTLHGSMHGPGYSGGSPLTASTKLADSAKLSDDFHLYSVEWAPNSVKFYLDSTLYETRTPADIPAGTQWVYNHPFFIILNLAVGGQWPGSPDQSTPFPAQMLVDYVHVYQAN